MRNYFIFILFLFYFFNNSFAQQNGCDFQFKNLLLNPNLTGTISTLPQPCEFCIGQVPSWESMQTIGQPFNSSPQIMGISNYSTYSLQWAGWFQTTSGGWQLDAEEIGQKINISQNKQYYFGFRARRLTTMGTGQGYIIAKFWDANTHYYQYLITKPIVSSNWLIFDTCLKANRNYDYVTIYPFSPFNSDFRILWVQTDSITLYETKPLIKNDTLHCDSNCITKCVTVDSFFSYVNFSLSWYDLSSPSSPISTNSSVRLCPSNTTNYILKDFNRICEGSDTFKISVMLRPSVNLGRDTFFCGPASYLLEAWFDSTCNYLWSTGAKTHSILVTKSGKYWVKVYNRESCYATDTVSITISPDFHIHPSDTIICKNGFPIRIRVDSGYTHYLWSNGDTLDYIDVDSAGLFWVTVTDSSGCFRTDTATISTIQPPFPYLGTDRYLCEGDSILICDTNSKIWYLFKYQWYFKGNLLAGDTNPCITVSDSGQYILNARTNDSCIGRDTINIIVSKKPIITCSGFKTYFCPQDPPEKITCSPDGGTYYGKGIKKIGNDWYFYPEDGSGTVIITYSYASLDTPHCVSSSNFAMTVDSIWADIQPIESLCINDDPDTLIGLPYGGNWFDINGGPISNIIIPSALGVGLHPYIYRYINNTCITYDTFLVSIIDSLNVNISQTAGDSCLDHKIMLTAETPPGSHYRYNWSTGDSSKSIFATVTGIYWVTVSDSFHKCSSTVSTEIHSICDPSTSPTPAYAIDLKINSPSNWDGINIIVDGDIEIDSTVLSIKNSHIIMRNCKKIKVSRQSKLEIYNTCIEGCNWQGIEVWGWYDACPADSFEQGKLYADHLTLTGANIGIYVGRRVETDVISNPEYSGGIIKVSNSHFKNNYVDIMFSPWTFDAVCYCIWTPDGQKWWSKVENSYFDTLATSSHCDEFVDHIIDTCNIFGITHYCNTYNDYPININDYIPLNRCHIVDLSPYVDVVFQFYTGALFCLSPWLTCWRWAGESGHYYSGSPLYSPSILHDNYYIDNCKLNTPPINYYFR